MLRSCPNDFDSRAGGCFWLSHQTAKYCQNCPCWCGWCLVQMLLRWSKGIWPFCYDWVDITHQSCTDAAQDCHFEHAKLSNFKAYQVFTMLWSTWGNLPYFIYNNNELFWRFSQHFRPYNKVDWALWIISKLSRKYCEIWFFTYHYDSS